MYYPSERKHYTAVGYASWYGDAFHGRRTANGEIFDKGSISAAHPTLPLPSYVRVTNINNGRSIIVRVNDRGPIIDGRIIDLSRQAMMAISMGDLAYVRLDLISQEEATKSLTVNISDLQIPNLLPRTR